MNTKLSKPAFNKAAIITEMSSPVRLFHSTKFRSLPFDEVEKNEHRTDERANYVSTSSNLSHSENMKNGLNRSPVIVSEANIESNILILKNNLFNDLMKTKAHLGTIKWTKIMSPFLFGYRNNISIFNMEHTIICLKQSLKILQNIKLKNGHILFVNTSPKYSALVRITASSINQSYINDRWIGGTLTNWKQVSESIFLFQKFAYQFDTFLKINNIQISNYIKAKKRYQGLRFFNPNQSIKLLRPLEFTRYNSPSEPIHPFAKQTWNQTNEQKIQTNLISNLPDIIIITNPEKNIIVLQEAKKYQIPVIGFVDSNTSNEDIQYLIPGNNQSTAFMYFCFNLFTIILKKK